MVVYSSRNDDTYTIVYSDFRVWGSTEQHDGRKRCTQIRTLNSNGHIGWVFFTTYTAYLCFNFIRCFDCGFYETINIIDQWRQHAHVMWIAPERAASIYARGRLKGLADQWAMTLRHCHIGVADIKSKIIGPKRMDLRSAYLACASYI